MKPFFLSAAIFIMASSAFASLGSDVEALTGGHTKVVYVEQTANAAPGEGWDAEFALYSLMGYDTRTGANTTILPGPACYSNPQFTPDGNQVIYSDVQNTKRPWIVNWDGTGKRELEGLAGAFVFCAWKDPLTQKIWLYLGDNYMHGEGSPKNASYWEYGLKRAPLDDPSKIETIFHSVSTNPNRTDYDWRLRLSRDGLYAGVANPWPNIGILDMKTGLVTQFARGCNQNIAPDNSYRMFNYEYSHAEIEMWGPKGAGPKTIIKTDFGGGESWAPRFSYNKAEIFTCNSPIKIGDIYIAKFNASFTGFTNHIRITTPNGKQKTSALAWVAEGPTSSSSSKETLIARGAPVLNGQLLRLPGSGVCAIDIFTPRGARAGSFQIKAPGAFDLSQAGLSNGVYQIRVRNGADIFWLKAPVVR